MGDGRGDGREDVGPDDRWMTYKEAASTLGITPASLERRVRRNQWARTRGNDGRALVAVPPDALEDAGKKSPGGQTKPVSPPGVLPDEALRIKALESEALVLRERLSHLSADLAQERQKSSIHEGERNEARRQLADAVSTLETVRRERLVAQTAAEAAKREAGDLRQKLAEARSAAAHTQAELQEVQKVASADKKTAEKARQKLAEAEAALAALRGRGFLSRLFNR